MNRKRQNLPAGKVWSVSRQGHDFRDDGFYPAALWRGAYCLNSSPPWNDLALVNSYRFNKIL